MKTLIFLCFTAVAVTAKGCGKNQHFEACGTACPLTCDNYDNPPDVCVEKCKIGCACDDGFVLNARKECVKPKICPNRKKRCGKNQHFESCGTACPLTCDNYDNPPEICVAICKIGCVCDEGYVLNARNKCVNPKKCQNKKERCGKNQHFESCGTACPLTCDNYDNPPDVCFEMCKIGCACDEGYVLNARNKCVNPKTCPNKKERCGKNQHFESCGTDCPLTCDNYKNPPEVCHDMCKIGCACDEGYVLNERKQCVKPVTCPNGREDNKAKQFSKDICDLPSETGLCEAYMPRYYFDKATGECKRFVYGGCGGNKNNFETVVECERACK